MPAATDILLEQEGLEKLRSGPRKVGILQAPSGMKYISYLALLLEIVGNTKKEKALS